MLALAVWLPAQAQAYSARVSVGSPLAVRPVAPNFLGLALEYNTIPKWAGATPQSVNPVFATLLHNLDPDGHPVIRVGGQSTDRSWWPVRGIPQPLGVTYNLWPGWTAAAQSLAQATGARLLLGINLEANRTRISQVEANQLVSRIGASHIAALEIGNEPDLYPLMPWYRTLHGRPIPWYSRDGSPIFSRPLSYSPQNYAQEFTRTRRVLPRVPLAGPETGQGPWMSMFAGFVGRGSQVRMLTSHVYGLNQCITDPRSPQYPSVPNLLSIVNSRDVIPGIGPYIARVHRFGGSYRIDEMGSISCNGRAGVSDTLASGLWAMDTLFAIASAGIDGVNLHTYPNSDNGLFDLTRGPAGWEATVHPLYYGALMFEQAAPAGSRLLRVGAGNQSRLRAWATRGPDHRVRVLLINDSLGAAARATVRLAGRHGPAGLERLRAASAYATGGVTLGGESFGPTTTTGVLPAPTPLTAAAHGGAYTVTLPAGSAALLTISPA